MKWKIWKKKRNKVQRICLFIKKSSAKNIEKNKYEIRTYEDDLVKFLWRYTYNTLPEMEFWF